MSNACRIVEINSVTGCETQASYEGNCLNDALIDLECRTLMADVGEHWGVVKLDVELVHPYAS